jgi:hypothetical protein
VTGDSEDGTVFPTARAQWQDIWAAVDAESAKLAEEGLPVGTTPLPMASPHQHDSLVGHGSSSLKSLHFTHGPPVNPFLADAVVKVRPAALYVSKWRF